LFLRAETADPGGPAARHVQGLLWVDNPGGTTAFNLTDFHLHNCLRILNPEVSKKFEDFWF
jgi:hypothetical protein